MSIPDDAHQESHSAGEGETGEKYFTGDVPEDNVPPPGSTRRSPQGRPPGTFPGTSSGEKYEF